MEKIMNILRYEASDDVNVIGSTKQGDIITTFDKLCEVFGDPTFTDADPREKVNCEWTVEAEIVDEYGDDPEDTVMKTFTVYSWKYGRIPTEECEWTIGGNDFEAWSIADDIINGKV